MEGTGEEEQQALTDAPGTACNPVHVPSVHPFVPSLQPYVYSLQAYVSQALMDELNSDMEALDASVDCYVIRDQASHAPHPARTLHADLR